KQAIAKMNGADGDGTTTTIRLTQGIVAEGVCLVAADTSPMLLKRGLDRAAEAAADGIREMAVPVQSRQDVVHVARSSVGEPELGDLVGDLVHRVGKEGIVSIEESRTLCTESEYVDGMVWNRGFVSA